MNAYSVSKGDVLLVGAFEASELQSFASTLRLYVPNRTDGSRVLVLVPGATLRGLGRDVFDLLQPGVSPATEAWSDLILSFPEVESNEVDAMLGLISTKENP